MYLFEIINDEQHEAGQRQTELPRESTGHSKHPLPNKCLTLSNIIESHEMLSLQN